MPRIKPKWNSDHSESVRYTFSSALRDKLMGLDGLAGNEFAEKFVNRLEDCVSDTYSKRPRTATKGEEIAAARDIAGSAEALAKRILLAPEGIRIDESLGKNMGMLYELPEMLQRYAENAKAYAHELEQLDMAVHRAAMNEKPELRLARTVADAMRKILGMRPSQYASNDHDKRSLYAEVLRLLLTAFHKSNRFPTDAQLRKLMSEALKK